ncbi:hypothetical protein Tco_1050227, partial [Tanacetum coccineum]
PTLLFQRKADDRLSWKLLQHEKLVVLQFIDKAKLQDMGADLKVKFESLELSMDLERTRKEHLEKHYPNLIFTQGLGHVPWTNERPLENRELNAIIGAWFTLWRD